MLIGVDHDKEYSTKISREILNLFKNFIKIKGQKNIIAIVEGPNPKNINSLNKHYLFSKYRESSVLIPFSRKHSIICISVEPHSNNLLSYALKTKGLKKNDIDVWILLNTLQNRLRSKGLLKYKAIVKRLDNILRFGTRKSVIHKIDKTMNEARDFYIAQSIKKLLKKKNIFGVYGVDHIKPIIKFIKK